ncbi:hypothetical protein GCM10010919_16640 [Alishewanella longhuensis]|uniref:NADH:quinone oxidoreductase/Mrp antiporter transmembrane domain-containing protein n=1 Tax=Alishewanella longhuensis TaxID=1091037 RepID=A0ABQ3KXS5_9ALTE|nr:complex I subunit 5 family protein [Alishewanella longhuensis]GHG67718.1 hypothetical protein GCM10010919_16640 [Alishewanella longhuensis]
MIDLSQLLWPGAGLGLTSTLQQGWFAFTLLLWLAAALYSLSSQRADRQQARYWLFMGLCFSGNLLLIAAQDALSFYLGFSLMSLAATALVLHTGSKAAKRAGRLYLQLAVLGELLLFSALVLRAAAAGGQYDWQSWQAVELDHLTISLFLLGLGLKAGFFPLHLWLPQAHPVAPAPASAVLSGAMIKAGIFGLWFFLPAGDATLQLWLPYLALLGLVSAYFGAIAALCHTAPKTILAYSSVSQMGYLLLLLTASWQLASSTPYTVTLLLLVAYAAHHAFAKGALFLLAGSAAKYRFAIFDKACALIAALSMMALPFSSGAAVKTALKTLTAELRLPYLQSISWLLSLGALLSALALWHFLSQLWQQQQLAHHRVPVLQQVAVALLAILLILLPWAWPLLQYYSLHALTSYAWLGLITPVLLALLGYRYLFAIVALPLQRIGQGSRWVFRLSLWLKRRYQPIRQLTLPAFSVNWRALRQQGWYKALRRFKG